MLSRSKLLNLADWPYRNLTGAFNLLSIVLLIGTLSGCGFHLRTENVSKLPVELKVIKLQIQVNKDVAVLNNLFVNEWQQAGGIISDSDDVPVLLIDGERVIRRVLSVSPTDAKVSEYSLKYVLSFKLTTPKNKKELISQKIHLQRQYTVDVNKVLAKEHEQAWLTNAMRHQAIEQVVRRISHLDSDILPISNVNK